MKIGIIGATGHVGQAMTKEAIACGYETTAIVRSAAKAKALFGSDVAVIEKDAMALTHDDLKDFDVVVDAFAPAQPYGHLDMATRLIADFREDDSTRLIFVIGSSILKNENGSTLLSYTLEKYAGEPWLDGVKQQGYEYEFLQWINNVQWTAITPSSEFTDGPHSDFKIGGEDLMTSAAGKAEVSVANFAAALADELDTPKHIQSQFSVVDA